MTQTPTEDDSSLFRRIAESAWLNITVGFILMATSLIECLEPVFGYDTAIEAEHGMALLGFVQFMKFLPDLVKGVQFVQHGEQHAQSGQVEMPVETQSAATESPTTAA